MVTAAQNNALRLDQLIQRVNWKGSITFAVTGSVGLFASVMFLNQLDYLVVVFMKAVSVMSPLLAWYWISVREDSRAATDAMFAAGLKMVLGCGHCWPKKLCSWVKRINEEGVNSAPG